VKSAQYRAGEPVCALKSMFQIGGIIFVFATVFGGYVLAGGKFDVILHALPYEGTQILGAAIGAMVIASSVPALKATLVRSARSFWAQSGRSRTMSTCSPCSSRSPRR